MRPPRDTTSAIPAPNAPATAPIRKTDPAPTRQVWLAGAALAGAALLAYGNTFSGPFIFDDKLAIIDNPSIRHLGTSLSPSLAAAGANGRPLVNLSLAVNYALGGLDVTGYHVVNLLFHVAASLSLFGLVRRTLQLAVLRDRFGAAAVPVAFVTALVWTVHPLLTESVTFVVQRNESMAGLCYLLVLYGLARAADSPRPHRWLAGSFLACVLGMLCKEIVVSAPLLAGFYQVVFIDGSWRTAWRKHGKFFALLATAWIPLAWLVAGNNQRYGTVGFGLGVAWWEYALTQCRAIVHYLTLCFWPHPLILDYGNTLIKNPAEVWPQILVLAGLLAGTAFAVRKKIPAAFPALCFWAILAPSSSILPLTTQTMAEHRMYLPLASVAVLLVTGLFSLAGARSLVAWGAVAIALIFTTRQRNSHYQNEITLWRETLKEVPGNPRAYANLAGGLDLAGQKDEAISNYEKAIQLKPDYAEVHTGLGSLLERIGRRPEAISHYLESLGLEPKSAQTHYNLGNIYAKQKRWAEAEREYAAAAQIEPDSAEIQGNFGNILVTLGRHQEAVPHLAAAVKAAPEAAGLRFNLATALAYTGHAADAMMHYEKFLQLKPDHAEAHFRLGALLAVAKRRPEAINHYQTALRLSPDYVEAHFLLGMALMQEGRRDEAAHEIEATLRLQPDFPGAAALWDKLRHP